MDTIAIQAGSVTPSLPATTGNGTGIRRLLRADEFLIATLLPVPAPNANGGLDIRA